MDVIDNIDAAVDGLCACPCRAAIADQSPSAYFASETCAARWHRSTHPRGRGRGGGYVPLAELAQMMQAALQTFCHAMGPLVQQMAQAAAQLEAAFQPPPPPPRHGPPRRPRAPRAIHPTRVRH